MYVINSQVKSGFFTWYFMESWPHSSLSASGDSFKPSIQGYRGGSLRDQLLEQIQASVPLEFLHEIHHVIHHKAIWVISRVGNFRANDNATLRRIRIQANAADRERGEHFDLVQRHRQRKLQALDRLASELSER